MMMDFVKILICIVVVMVVTLLQTVINLQKNYRARQVLLPLVALLYSIIAVIIAWDNVHKVTEWIANYQELARFSEETAQLADFINASEVAILNIRNFSSFF